MFKWQEEVGTEDKQPKAPRRTGQRKAASAVKEEQVQAPASPVFLSRCCASTLSSSCWAVEEGQAHVLRFISCLSERGDGRLPEEFFIYPVSTHPPGTDAHALILPRLTVSANTT